MNEAGPIPSSMATRMHSCVSMALPLATCAFKEKEKATLHGRTVLWRRSHVVDGATKESNGECDFPSNENGI